MSSRFPVDSVKGRTDRFFRSSRLQQNHAMIRTAFISDIHGNLSALRAVLKAIDHVGVDRIICLGDVVGYGPEPGACLDLVAQRCSACVRGNHEEAVLTPSQGETFNASARAALTFTTKALEARHLAQIQAMPSWASLAQDVVCVHDSPVPVEQSGYVRAAAVAERVLWRMCERWSFVGHTHLPAIFAGGPRTRAVRIAPFPGEWVSFESHRRYLVNPGSVGQPRDGDARASWGLLESNNSMQVGRFRVERVVYGVDAVCDAIRGVGLPEALGRRLLVGA